MAVSKAALASAEAAGLSSSSGHSHHGNCIAVFSPSFGALTIAYGQVVRRNRHICLEMVSESMAGLESPTQNCLDMSSTQNKSNIPQIVGKLLIANHGTESLTIQEDLGEA